MNEKLPDTPSIWIDPDDAPELTDDWFESADLYDGGRLVRRGRTGTAATEALTIHYDAEVVAYFRGTGPDWQARMNSALKEWIEAHS